MTSSDTDKQLHWSDWVVIVGYFIAVISVGLLVSSLTSSHCYSLLSGVSDLGSQLVNETNLGLFRPD